MNKMLSGGTLIAALLFFVSGQSTAQFLVPCTSHDASDIMVPEGVDCEVFFEPLDRPTGLAVEADGNVLVTVSGTFTGAESVVRISPDGVLLDVSDPIINPDGVAVATADEIYVSGSPVTIANSLDGGFNEVCRSVPGNMQDGAVDSQGRIVVKDFAGTISDVVCNTINRPCVTLGQIGVGVAFDESDRLFATRHLWRARY